MLIARGLEIRYFGTFLRTRTTKLNKKKEFVCFHSNINPQEEPDTTPKRNSSKCIQGIEDPIAKQMGRIRSGAEKLPKWKLSDVQSDPDYQVPIGQ
jgi:hypothetical protein